jgi:hypothetical protein
MSTTNSTPPESYGYAPEGKNTGVVKSKGKPTLHRDDAGIPIRSGSRSRRRAERTTCGCRS